MEPLPVIMFVWVWHFFWMLLLTIAVGMAAYSHNGGWPFSHPASCKLQGPCKFRVIHWPISGRWLITGLFLMITCMIGDIALLSIRVWRDDIPTTLTWQNVLVRAAPIFLEPWVFWRQWKQGLVND